MENGTATEVAISGNEGLVGIALFLAVKRRRPRLTSGELGNSGFDHGANDIEAEYPIA